MIETQKAGFEELFKAFYQFFLDAIGSDSSICNKIRLQMMTQYFDDLPLYKVINPIVARINSNPEDRRAIARAALWDAIFAHHNGKLFEMYQTKELKPNEPIRDIPCDPNLPTPDRYNQTRRSVGRPRKAQV